MSSKENFQAVVGQVGVCFDDLLRLAKPKHRLIEPHSFAASVGDLKRMGVTDGLGTLPYVDGEVVVRDGRFLWTRKDHKTGGHKTLELCDEDELYFFQGVNFAAGSYAAQRSVTLKDICAKGRDELHEIIRAKVTESGHSYDNYAGVFNCASFGTSDKTSSSVLIRTVDGNENPDYTHISQIVANQYEWEPPGGTHFEGFFIASEEDAVCHDTPAGGGPHIHMSSSECFPNTDIPRHSGHVMDMSDCYFPEIIITPYHTPSHYVAVATSEHPRAMRPALDFKLQAELDKAIEFGESGKFFEKLTGIVPFEEFRL